MIRNNLLSIFVVTLSSFSIYYDKVNALDWEELKDYRRAKLQIEVTNQVGLKEMENKHTNVNFVNTLEDEEYFKNLVAHNGSGVTAADIDLDGLTDIYFANLQGSNKLYKNLGNWSFMDITNISGVGCENQMSTGVVFADINNDGCPDLLVNGISAGTRLFLNDGKGTFTEDPNSGLNSNGSSTSMALADVDNDGDLDLYVTNYIDKMYIADLSTKFSIGRKDGSWKVLKVNGKSIISNNLKNRFVINQYGKIKELPEADKFYINNGNGKFKEIIIGKENFLNVHGKPYNNIRDWGLAVAFRDLNGDRAPDIYVCNDSSSPDRLWINDGRGNFQAANYYALRHTSRSSMGIDFSDINNDGNDDMFIVDMLAIDHERRLLNIDIEKQEPYIPGQTINIPRYNRNSMLLSRGDGTWFDIANYSGLEASDWSWSVIFIDLDLDGSEDILISNGFSFNIMDIDSKNRITNLQKNKILSKEEKSKLQSIRPSWESANCAFRNLGNLKFKHVSEEWGFTKKGITYGMCLADLDNDGDQDLIANNLNETASLYKNLNDKPRIAVNLKGRNNNSLGIGSRIKYKTDNYTNVQEIIAGGRYLSGDQPLRVFAALPSRKSQLIVEWQNGYNTIIANPKPNYKYEIREPREGTNNELKNNYNNSTIFKNVSYKIPKHNYKLFKPLDRNILLKKNFSRYMPLIKSIDLNDDNYDDIVIRTENNFEFLINKESNYRKYNPLKKDNLISNFTDISKDIIRKCEYADFDGDGLKDMLIAESWGNLRLYLNKSGKFIEHSESWGLTKYKGLWNKALAFDANNDGKLDFIATNWGRNSSYEKFFREGLNNKNNIALFESDINDDEILDYMIITNIDNRWVPFEDYLSLNERIPGIINSYSNHSKMVAKDLEKFYKDKFYKNNIKSINHLKTTLFLNNGSSFQLFDLPDQVQFTPNFDICVGDVNADGNEDVFLSQNYFSVYNNNSRNDSGLGLLLLGRGNGEFDYVSSNSSGLKLYGEQRGASFTDYNNDGKSDLIVSQLGIKTSLFRNTFPRRGILVKLKKELVGSELRLIYKDGSKGPKRISRSTSEVLGKEKQADSMLINMNNKISKRVKIDNKYNIYIE